MVHQKYWDKLVISTKLPILMIVWSTLNRTSPRYFLSFWYNCTHKVACNIILSLSWKRLSIPIFLASVRIMDHCIISNNRPKIFLQQNLVMISFFGWSQGVFRIKQYWSKVVYMSCTILQLTVGSRDLSQAEKKLLLYTSLANSQNLLKWSWARKSCYFVSCSACNKSKFFLSLK